MRKRDLWLSRNQPVVLMLLILFSGFIWALQWFFPPLSYQDIYHHPGLLMPGSQGFDLPAVWNIALGYPLYLLSLFLVYKINSRFQIVSEGNYLPVWIYLMVTSTDYRFIHFSPDLVSVNIFLIVVFLFFQTTNKKRNYKTLFYCGFLLSAASLMNALSLVFMLYILFGLYMIKTFNWRESGNFILGVITAAAITTGVIYLTDNMDVFQHMPGINRIFPGTSVPDYKALLQDFVLGLFLITSLLFLITRFGFLNINVRRYFRLIILLLVFSLPLYFLSGMEIMFRFFLAIPVGYILTHFLVYTKQRFLAGSFLWIMFLLMIISEILAVINNLSLTST
jgi:hypothetical protein